MELRAQRRRRVKTNWTPLALAALLSLFLSTQAPGATARRNLILATTTSTQDSGLLDELIPAFEKKTGFFVKTIAVGSGQAMVMGRKGEADVLLVHSPEDEAKFMAEGHGVDRRLVMHNDFLLVGPPEDPAKIRGEKSAAQALRKILQSGNLFLSRGDHSGTHAREMALWRRTGLNPEAHRTYQQTGLGMGQTLSVASEKSGYTLADRGTFLSLRKNLSLVILTEGQRDLFNVYHVIAINPANRPRVNAAGAKAFGDFLVAPQAQAIIKSFGVATYGSPLFVPDSGKKVEELGR
jgi:tungstate transport system substrate-binding protein